MDRIVSMIKKNDSKGLRRLIDSEKVDLTAAIYPPYGSPIFTFACHVMSLDCAQVLLEAKADINGVSGPGAPLWTSLHNACSESLPPVILSSSFCSPLDVCVCGYRL